MKYFFYIGDTIYARYTKGDEVVYSGLKIGEAQIALLVTALNAALKREEV